jgi:SAM-dependent methyltransferase
MFTASAELYDIIYSSFKDYGAEADRIAVLLHSERPGCRTVLDVGCGTGEHARLLTARGFQVDGLDLDPNLLRLARAKNPASSFHEADMCSFDIPARYDAILCLFSSIGYARTQDRVVRALTCFRRHLAPGGVVVVEPWFTPETMKPDHTSSQTVEDPPRRIIRTSKTQIKDRVSRLIFEYEVTGPDGTSHASELHELGLFTVDEMKHAFSAAGLSSSYDSTGLTGRGLYIARALPDQA